MARKTDTTNTIEAAANPPVTLTPQALQALIEEVTALRSAVAKAEANAAKPAVTSKSAENLAATVRAFKRLGIKDIQPHVNVLTFKKWTEAGYRPKEGSKAVKVANLRLWHVSQVRALTKDEIKAMKSQAAEADKRAKANVTELHPAS